MLDIKAWFLLDWNKGVLHHLYDRIFRIERFFMIGSSEWHFWWTTATLFSQGISAKKRTMWTLLEILKKHHIVQNVHNVLFKYNFKLLNARNIFFTQKKASVDTRARVETIIFLKRFLQRTILSIHFYFFAHLNLSVI